MILTKPNEYRYVHTAVAITREHVSALRRAFDRLIAEGVTKLPQIPVTSRDDPTTPLDLRAIGAARGVAIAAIAAAPALPSLRSLAASLEALSLVPREVSAIAEEILANRSARLARMVELGVSSDILDEEAIVRLDARRAPISDTETSVARAVRT